MARILHESLLFGPGTGERTEHPAKRRPEATDLVAVRTALQAAGVDYDSAEAEFVPDMQVELDRDAAGKVFRLVEALEDLDDVQNVFANFDVPDAVLAELD